MSKLLKSQLWYFDFILGLTIFTLILLVSYRYIGNSYVISGKDVNSVMSESNKLSETLMTSGLPTNWTQDNVVSIGIVTDNVLNITKLDQFKNMTNSDYTNVKNMFGLRSEFIVFFHDKDGNLLNVTDQEYIGSGYTLEDVEDFFKEEMVYVTRYTTYKHDDIAQIISLKVVMWQV